MWNSRSLVIDGTKPANGSGNNWSLRAELGYGTFWMGSNGFKDQMGWGGLGLLVNRVGMGWVQSSRIPLSALHQLTLIRRRVWLQLERWLQMGHRKTGRRGLGLAIHATPGRNGYPSDPATEGVRAAAFEAVWCVLLYRLVPSCGRGHHLL